MGSPFGPAFVIANPRAGKGYLRRQPGHLQSLLEKAGLEFELHETQGRLHATELASKALDSGFEYLVAVGGDGTVHEVVNGMMGDGAPRNPEAVLGVISAGSGTDYVRTFGLPMKPEESVPHLTGDSLMQVDVGRVTHTQNGVQASEYFPNTAEAGLGGDVARRAEKLPRRMGASRYLLGFWMTLGFTKATTGRVVMDSHTYEGRITNIVVANGQFFGGGMHVAPRAHPGDGKFDVLIQIGTKMDYVTAIAKVYRGEHLPSPAIKEYMSARVEVTTDLPLQVEADGEILGTTPAVFELIPNAIRLKI